MPSWVSGKDYALYFPSCDENASHTHITLTSLHAIIGYFKKDENATMTFDRVHRLSQDRKAFHFSLTTSAQQLLGFPVLREL